MSALYTMLSSGLLLAAGSTENEALRSLRDDNTATHAPAVSYPAHTPVFLYLKGCMQDHIDKKIREGRNPEVVLKFGLELPRLPLTFHYNQTHNPPVYVADIPRKNFEHIVKVFIPCNIKDPKCDNDFQIELNGSNIQETPIAYTEPNDRLHTPNWDMGEVLTHCFPHGCVEPHQIHHINIEITWGCHPSGCDHDGGPNRTLDPDDIKIHAYKY